MGFGPLSDLERDVALAEDVTNDLTVALDHLDEVDVERCVHVWDRIEGVRRVLADLSAALQHRIGEAMSEKRVTVAGMTVERHREMRRRNWQSDDLLRVVLDTRVVNPETGEAESQIDILKAVYGLAGYQARVGALRERGIDPDEFCETEMRGWTLRVHKGG